MSKDDLKSTFTEFKDYTCAFNDCGHDNQLGCSIIEATEKGEILQSRYDNYKRFLKEINENSSKLYK
jgi:ribosome biogenesis GTPase